MKKFYQNVVTKARIGNLSMTMGKLHNKKRKRNFPRELHGHPVLLRREVARVVGF